MESIYLLGLHNPLFAVKTTSLPLINFFLRRRNSHHLTNLVITLNSIVGVSVLYVLLLAFRVLEHHSHLVYVLILITGSSDGSLVSHVEVRLRHTSILRLLVYLMLL